MCCGLSTQSTHYSAILCLPRQYSSDVPPVTSNTADCAPVYVCVCMLDVLPSSGPPLK